MSTLEESFPVCPACGAPWQLHWKYRRGAGQLRRRYNTCGLSREQLEAQHLDRSAP